MVVRFGAVAVAILLVASCGGNADQTASSRFSTTSDSSVTTPTHISATSSTIDAVIAGWVDSFEVAWLTINEKYFDPDIGGVDWQAVHDRYLPQISEASTGLHALYLINTMLWELDVSHIGVAPPDDPTQLNSQLSEGELGLDIRLLDEEWVITEVKPGSPAAAAGLQLGYLLETIGAYNVEALVALAPTMPPRHERGIRSGMINIVRSLLYGEPGAAVTIGFRDGDDAPGEVTLTFRQRERLPGAEPMAPSVPAAFTTLEVNRLQGNIGYLRFDAFGHGMLPALLDTVDALQDTSGLIIDVRGNYGGTFHVRKPLIDRLVNEPVLLQISQWRDSREEVYVEPAELTYDAPIVVLVDVLSTSSAELFAGTLQAIGRAFVIGESTAGRVLVQGMAELPNGAIMIYPEGQPLLPDGTPLEGHGVIPDLAVDLHRSDLRAGTDPPLQAAIDHLRASAG